MLKSVNNIIAKQIVLGMDFNLHFDSLLESQGRNPILKTYILLKWLSLKIPWNFAIFLGLAIPKWKNLLFGKIIGLDLFNVERTFFVSIFCYMTYVLALFCNDHSPILFALDMIKEGQRGRGLGKFNSSLLSNKKSWKII